MVSACDSAPQHMKNVQIKTLNLHWADIFMLGNIMYPIQIINKYKMEIITDQLFGVIVVLLLELGIFVWRFQHSNYPLRWNLVIIPGLLLHLYLL